MIDHDVPSGPLDRCQICGTSDLEEVLDLSHQPLSDSLLSTAQLRQPEPHYPLRLNRCLDCGLTQLDYIVPGEVVYSPDYPYRSGITRELAEYQRAFASDVIDMLGLAEGALCVDIGSNDGTLLTGFRDRGMRALGVEPTNIARIAVAENGIETIQRFFTEEVADEIVRNHGHAGVVTATNVFAHMSTLGEVMRGLVRLLGDDGVFITESHYLLDVIEGTQYDTIYHEHIRTYALKPLVRLFEQYGLEVFNVQRASRYGGNIRAYARRRGSGRTADASVGKLLKLEHERGLYGRTLYDRFRERVLRSRDQLIELAHSARREGRSFVGNSCPARAVTLLNYCGMHRGLMPWIAEQPTSLKLGLHLPGLHQPILVNDRLIEEQPDYVLLLAWHYARPIAEQLRARGLRSQLIVPLPEVRLLDL